ncbi:hypothetical protein DBV05_g2079 [Lasiodiplodia theobromae]|uniref:Uncharacterized protein n=1 Tax=Lasiodiplodia theobromae TaxID=45133 RepID=A0A5N5DQV8_9PEZI|nr:hypothetical protein DBV05_g2079 [Lasiodiplodia theobromae]
MAATFQVGQQVLLTYDTSGGECVQKLQVYDRRETNGNWSYQLSYTHAPQQLFFLGMNDGNNKYWFEEHKLQAA